jgi:hypothetical protein
VTPEHLEPLARVLAPGAEFRVATDIPDYVRQTLQEVPRHGLRLAGRGTFGLAGAVGRLAFHPLRAEGAARGARAALPDVPARLAPFWGVDGIPVRVYHPSAAMSGHGAPVPMTARKGPPLKGTAEVPGDKSISHRA